MEDVWVLLMVLSVSFIVAVPAIALLLWCCDRISSNSGNSHSDDVEAMMMMDN